MPNLANMQNIFMLGFQSDEPRLEYTMHSAAILEDFRLFMGHRPSPCIVYLLKHYSRPENRSQLEVHMIIDLFYSRHVDIENVEHLVKEKHDLDRFDDPLMKWVGSVMQNHQMNARKSQKLAKLDANVYFEAIALQLEAMGCNAVGDYRFPISLCSRARKLLSLCGLDRLPTEYSVLSTMAEAYYQISEYAEARKIHMDMENATSDQECLKAHALTNLRISKIDIITGRTSKGGNTLMAKKLLCQSLKARFCKEMITSSLEVLETLNNWGVSDIDWVLGWATIFLGHALKFKNKCAIHKALFSLGDIFMAAGDSNTALGLFTVVLEEFTWMDVHRSRAGCMLRLGKISQKRGQLEEAIAFWKAARPLIERSSQAKDVAHIYNLVSEAEQKHTDQLAHLTTLNAPNTLVQNQTRAPVEAVVKTKEESEGISG
ncbi:hypothetical protein B0H13DRAFT_1869574 [Mycena leptocephala]|nr:hypothetical protein B0H13DRAFT_1869574 [Mycena leptocephala]